MFKNNSKFPRFLIYMLIALMTFMLLSIFFSSTFVGVLYFIGIIVMAVFFILDKKYGMQLTSHKLMFILFDIINLIAIIAVLYYERANHSSFIHYILIALIVVLSLTILFEIFLLNDNLISKKDSLFIDIIQLCSAICNFTYFYKVSEFWFAVVSLSLETAGLIFKVILTYINKKKLKKNEKIDSQNNDRDNESQIEKIITSENNEGDME